LQRVTGEGLRLKPKPKNDKIREVALPPTIVNLLRHEYATRYEGTEKEYHGDDYICAWPDGRPIAPDYITHEYEKMELPITFHGCRHSHDTLLFRLHVDTKLVADRTGRDEDLTRRTYEHVIPDMQDEVAMLIEQTLFGPDNEGKK
jgi:integrase